MKTLSYPLLLSWMTAERTSGLKRCPCWPAKDNMHYIPAEQFPMTKRVCCSCSNISTPPTVWDNKQRNPVVDTDRTLSPWSWSLFCILLPPSAQMGSSWSSPGLLAGKETHQEKKREWRLSRYRTVWNNMQAFIPGLKHINRGIINK